MAAPVCSVRLEQWDFYVKAGKDGAEEGPSRSRS